MKEDIIQFGISKIETKQFAILEENYNAKVPVELDTNLSFKLDTNEKQVAVSLTFSFLQKKKAFLKLENVCYFHINDDSWGNIINETNMILPNNFATHLAIVSIGTARGVLHSRTTNTLFNKFIVPTINIKELVPKDVVFNLPKD